jgi:hypothetical protein
MNDNDQTGNLKIYFYVATPNRPDMPSDTRVRFSRRTLYTGYALTREDAALVARHFKQMNAGIKETHACWQAYPIEID